MHILSSHRGDGTVSYYLIFLEKMLAHHPTDDQLGALVGPLQSASLRKTSFKKPVPSKKWMKCFTQIKYASTITSINWYVL